MKHTFYINSVFCLSFMAWNLVLGAQVQITDAAFIQIDDKLGKVVYHRVLEHQTLYAIARGYGVPESRLLEVNPKLTDRRSLPPVLMIPISDQQILYRMPLFKNKNEYVAVYYQVQAKDNLFRVSRVYFDMPTNLLSNRNNLDGDDLNIGQTLHIGWLKSEYEPLIVHEGRKKEEGFPGNTPGKELAVRFMDEYANQNLISKNEVAFWKLNEDSKGFFIMHRHALPESIIEIKNPMYDSTVYAKVIGNIPAHLYPKEVDMVISKEVALALGAVDAKFFVRSRYKPDRVSASR